MHAPNRPRPTSDGPAADASPRRPRPRSGNDAPPGASLPPTLLKLRQLPGRRAITPPVPESTPDVVAMPTEPSATPASAPAETMSDAVRTARADAANPEPVVTPRAAPAGPTRTATGGMTPGSPTVMAPPAVAVVAPAARTVDAATMELNDDEDEPSMIVTAIGAVSANKGVIALLIAVTTAAMWVGRGDKESSGPSADRLAVNDTAPDVMAEPVDVAELFPRSRMPDVDPAPVPSSLAQTTPPVAPEAAAPPSVPIFDPDVIAATVASNPEPVFTPPPMQSNPRVAVATPVVTTVTTPPVDPTRLPTATPNAIADWSRYLPE